MRLTGWHPPQAPATLEADLERLVGCISGLRVDVRRPAQVISVLQCQDATYLGLSLAWQNLSPYPGGAPPYVADAGFLTRAEWKLQEAIECFALQLQSGQRALDLGASPGGWSRLLLRYGLAVTAVDPQPRGMGFDHPRLDYRACRAQDYLAANGEPSFDWIVNDMVLEAEESSEWMVQAARRLKPTGQALLTLKLRRLDGPESRRGDLRRSLDILREAYRIPRIRQLYFNRNEVTVWLQRRFQGSS